MTTEPNTITFHNSNADWVMRITADRRIEVNEGVEVTEAAQKVLDAMQYLLKAQRPWVLQREWVDLTDEEIDKWAHELHGVIYAVMADLKDKNSA